jgi:hypothetical protein
VNTQSGAREVPQAPHHYRHNAHRVADGASHFECVDQSEILGLLLDEVGKA